MRFTSTEISDVYAVEIDPIEDPRGSFARSFCAREFEDLGLDPCVAQCNVSFNLRRGTLRGMHYQIAPHEEAKLVRVTRGSVYDVVVDLRPESPTFRRWVSAELRSDLGNALYAPKGVAHGFQTLEDDTEVFYQMSYPYHPDAGRGVRYDDPTFGIDWPIGEIIISGRDRAFELFEP